MSMTYKCRLYEKFAHMEEISSGTINIINRRDFDCLLNRRQLMKISTATQIALAMFKYFSINDKLCELDCDPTNTPIVICNRYANWDYVADTMSSCIENTMDGVNSYVATAWFPATIQGYLTIENSNVGEGITISTKDTGLISATINALMPENHGALILGTFECVPKQLAGQTVTGKFPVFSGALSLIKSSTSAETIDSIINSHQELYNHVTE